ncbi:MAG TPA: FAD-dependent oxidoreductase [Solirubrobacteraceae bacterium]
MTPDTSFNVIVAGGGIAGVEALLALRDLAGDRAQVTLLSPDDEFVYRPFSVAAPFGLGHAERIPLRKIGEDTGARWVQDALAGVDDAAGTVRTDGGEELPFDALLVAVGATPVVGVEHATTWWPGGDPEVLGGLLRDVSEGYVKSLAFVVPSGFVWPLPTYELALMTAREAKGMGQDGVAITLLTPEQEPLALFGPQAGAALREELERAGVRLVTGTAASVRRAGSGLEVTPAAGGEPLLVERAIAVPRVIGPALAGLPADDEGFVRTGADGRVEGLERTWAAGDGTASPIKLGGLATWQAGRAAAAIAALAGAPAEAPGDDAPVLEGVLMTGVEPRPLDGADPQGRRAHVPLWHPAGKVAGRWLPRYVGDERAPAAQEAERAVRVERTVSDVRAVDAAGLYDLSRPIQANSAEIRRLGSHMHGHH